MAKQHEFSEHEYEIFQKIHGYANPLEEEQGKVWRERSNYTRLRRKSEARLKRLLHAAALDEEVDAWEDEVAQADLEARAERELRNARTHRRRLKGLEKHVDREL